MFYLLVGDDNCSGHISKIEVMKVGKYSDDVSPSSVAARVMTASDALVFACCTVRLVRRLFYIQVLVPVASTTVRSSTVATTAGKKR